MKENYPAWDCSRDYSYQANATTQKNYKMAVYDGDGNILWGNDPVTVKRDTVNVYWYDRAGMTVISQYDGSDSAKTFDGRFWLLKENSLTDEERTSLNQIGVNILETSRYQGKGIHLLKSSLPIKKKTLDSALSEFYNAFAVDDTTRIPLTLYPDDIYEQTQMCDANDSCTTVVNTRSAIEMVVECWPDLSMGGCKHVVMQCSGDTAYIDRRVILAKVHRDSLQCLEKHKDVSDVRVRQKGILINDKGRKAIKLTELQEVDFKWKQALQATKVTADWLEGADYTGEGIIVGVYDGGIDFTHPGFNELDENGKDEPRMASADADFWGDKEYIYVEHGTHVAGIIGGNGRMSEMITNASPYQFRGVAPKIKFYSGENNFYNQKGDVVNHSHIAKGGDYDGERFFYGKDQHDLDWNIFKDWKDFSNNGDSRSKTVILGVGNNGYKGNNSALKGYYSLLNDSKNAILVGSFNSESKELSDFSSMGPTWDGRIKPDIMAPGENIMSCTLYGYYGTSSGTSMATPFVSGIIALLYQKFQKQTGVPLESFSMRNSTTKALLIHSAIDMQGCSNTNVDIENQNQSQTCTPYTQGPDFATGWGRVDAKGALSLITGYDANARTFMNFREFEVYEGVQNRKIWNMYVPEGRNKLRTTIVWDDAPGKDYDMDNYMTKKLVNDLDLYLVSPSGKIYYPWRLKPLPAQNVFNKYGGGADYNSNRLEHRFWGFEKITFADAATSAYNRECDSYEVVLDGCFDRRNNVEVVDVDNPEAGLWQVITKAYGRVEPGNSSDGKAQIASIVSDFELMDKMYNGEHPYEANAKMWEIRDLGDGFLEHYVTFSSETSLGQGDHIYLYDERNHLIGDYVGNSLANRRVIVKTRFLKIILFSNDDDSQGWGYSISKVEHVPYGVLQVLFPPYKKGD
jgi:subtilisin family serine protease